jgi:hypothetical protein
LYAFQRLSERRAMQAEIRAEERELPQEEIDRNTALNELLAKHGFLQFCVSEECVPRRRVRRFASS